MNSCHIMLLCFLEFVISETPELKCLACAHRNELERNSVVFQLSGPTLSDLYLINTGERLGAPFSKSPSS